jgi:hypothetical protein
MTVMLPVVSVGHEPIGWGIFGALPVPDPLLLPEPELPELPELLPVLLPELELLPPELLPEPEPLAPELPLAAPDELPLLPPELELPLETPPLAELPLPPELAFDGAAPLLLADPPGPSKPPPVEPGPLQPTVMTIPAGTPSFVHVYFIFPLLPVE